MSLRYVLLKAVTLVGGGDGPVRVVSGSPQFVVLVVRTYKPRYLLSFTRHMGSGALNLNRSYSRRLTYALIDVQGRFDFSSSSGWQLYAHMKSMNL